MTVVVTGASGFLGGAVVRHLINQGQRVRALDLKRGPTLNGLDIEFVHGDVLDPSGWDRALRDVDVVYHLVGLISITGDPDGRVQMVNVDGVHNVATAALTANVRRFVHCSSVHAYDMVVDQGFITENSPRSTAPGLPAYDRSKASGERVLREVIEEGLDAVIVNPTGIIGPYDFEPSRMGHVLKALFQGKIPALPDAGFNWVDSRDVAMSLTVAAEKGRTGENYLLGGHHRSVRDLALAAEEFSGVAPPRYRIPMAVARMLSPLGDLLVRRTGNPLWYTRESLHALTHSPQVSSRKAAEELGHRPRPVEETIGDIYDWFSENDLLG